MRSNKNIICIGDLHLSHWIRNNPEKDYRMKIQPRKLAERISELMKEYDTDYFFLLGDLIDSWDEDPSVINVLKNFYQVIIDSNPDAYIGFIEGQHDLLIRDKYKDDNSYIHLVASVFPKNVHYMHDKYLKINNTTLYFSSFHRKNPIYPSEHVNIFFSHITFGFNHKIDDSNFDLCVAGDIHSIYDSGKCHSTCTPYQHYAVEEKIGYISVISLNGKDSKFKRVKSDSEKFEFLKFENKVSRKVRKIEDNNEVDVKINDSDIMKLIQNEISKEKLESIHSMMDLTKIPVPMNFNFKLHQIIIDNIRSIDHLEINFDELSGINYIYGLSGAGKSTIFYSIITAIIGPKSKETFIAKRNKITKGPMRIQLWLTYDNKEYYIDRHPAELEFKINDDSKKMSMRDTQKLIDKELSFAKYYKYFYIKAKSSYFGSLDKSELMSVLFNLKIFDLLFKQSESLMKKMHKNCKKYTEDIIALKSEVKQIESEIELNKNELNKFNEIKESEDELKSKIDEIQYLKSEYNKYQNEISKYEIRLNEIKSLLLNYEIASNFSIEEINKELDSSKLKLSNIQNENAEFISNKKQLERLINSLDREKNRKIPLCPHCNKPLESLNESHIKEIQNEIESLKSKINEKYLLNTQDLINYINTLNNNIYAKKKYDGLINESELVEGKINHSKDKSEDLKSKILKIESDYSMNIEETINYFINQISKIKERMRLEQVVLRLENSKNEKSKLIDELRLKRSKDDEIEKLANKYNELFDIENPKAINFRILKKLVHYLSTENIKFESTKGENEFNINVYIKIKNQWISYSEASDGQKNYLDIFILIRITEFLNGVGLLIMDEPLTNMDKNYIDEACNLIPEINAETILITSHTRISGYDHRIEVELNDEGLTRVKL